MPRKTALLLAFVSLMASSSTTTDVPKSLRGTWIVRRVIPTATITCWGGRDSKKLIGTHIEYSAHGFRWQDIHTDSSEITLDRLTAEQFHDENSGGGAADSQVSLKDLGIGTPDVNQISFSHPDAAISEATNEIPGDRVLIKDRNAIVFSVCNVWFEAKREAPPRTH